MENLEKEIMKEDLLDELGISLLYQEQIHERPEICGNILILTDRYEQAAYELAKIFKEKTNATVVVKVNDTTFDPEAFHVDLIIVYGYLKHSHNYELVRRIRSHSEHVKALMYALRSEASFWDITQQDLEYFFDRYHSLNDFLTCLEFIEKGIIENDPKFRKPKRSIDISELVERRIRLRELEAKRSKKRLFSNFFK